MQDLLDKLTAVSKTKQEGKNVGKSDDDFIDRLSSHYTVILLIVFAVVVTTQTFIGKAISCWEPVHFTDNHVEYANSYCWIKNTYYVPSNERIPRPNEERHHIPYYQWVPFILLIQAVFFHLPSVVWHGLNQKGGVDCDSILHSSHKLTKTKELEDREKMLDLITKLMHRFLMARHQRQEKFHCTPLGILKTLSHPCSTRFGNYLTILFLISKVLYMANVVAQLFILNSVLATEYSLYGFQILAYVFSQRDWTDSPGVAFPRVTYCDFIIRRLGNNHRYTIQCTLPINLYNEKIFMFLWFWMVLIAVITALGILVWVSRAVCSSDRRKFIKNHLQLGGKRHDIIDIADLAEFLNDYLAQDGVFVLRLIAHNTNAINVTELTGSLWEKFKETKTSGKWDKALGRD